MTPPIRLVQTKHCRCQVAPSIGQVTNKRDRQSSSAGRVAPPVGPVSTKHGHPLQPELQHVPSSCATCQTSHNQTQPAAQLTRSSGATSRTRYNQTRPVAPPVRPVTTKRGQRRGLPDQVAPPGGPATTKHDQWRHLSDQLQPDMTGGQWRHLSARLQPDAISGATCRTGYNQARPVAPPVGPVATERGRRCGSPRRATPRRRRPASVATRPSSPRRDEDEPSSRPDRPAPLAANEQFQSRLVALFRRSITVAHWLVSANDFEALDYDFELSIINPILLVFLLVFFLIIFFLFIFFFSPFNRIPYILR